MSDDQWNTPKPPHINPPGQDQGDGWDVENELPRPGDSWDNAHSPKPIHHVDEDEWGTAPFDGSVQHPSQQGFNAPGPGQAPHPSVNVYPGASPQAGSNQGYPGAPQHNMTYQPSSSMVNTQMDTNDIVALVVTAFLPGAGHIILGQTAKGIAIIAALVLTCGMAAIAWPVILIDAFMVAQARKKRPVGDWEVFPK